MGDEQGTKGCPSGGGYPTLHLGCSLAWREGIGGWGVWGVGFVPTNSGIHSFGLMSGAL